MVIPQRRKPSYAIASVDNALRLIQMLRDLGEVRGKEAAEALDISPSTVHRLMSMLVYRGFAIQSDSRVYLPGPSVGVAPAAVRGAKRIQELVRPHLFALEEDLGESAYLMILTGRVIRFLLTAESGYPAHAGDRHGFVIPAHSSAGGRAILSALTMDQLTELYAGGERDGVDLDEAQLAQLMLSLEGVRSRGYAHSAEEVERGIITVAAPIRLPWLRTRAAISVSAPAIRRAKLFSADSITSMMHTRNVIERELDESRADLIG